MKEWIGLILIIIFISWVYGNFKDKHYDRGYDFGYEDGYADGQLDPLYPEDIAREYIINNPEEYCGESVTKEPARYVPKYAPSKEAAAFIQKLKALYFEYEDLEIVRRILIEENYEPSVIDYEIDRISKYDLQTLREYDKEINKLEKEGFFNKFD